MKKFITADSDASSDHEAHSSNNTSMMQAANEEKKLTTASGTSVGSLSAGKYIIVRFAKKNCGFKYYVAHVCSMPADQKSEVEVSCLRKKSGGSVIADMHLSLVLMLITFYQNQAENVVVLCILAEFLQLLVLLLNDIPRDSQRTVN